MAGFSKALRTGALFCIRCYQWGIAGFLGGPCRFEPSCSQYAIVAIGRLGIVRGTYWSVLRIMRCHPWHPGGVDPVPFKIKGPQ